MGDYNIRLDSLESAIKDIQASKLVILLDNPHREGEGDFICSAAKATPEIINQMITLARGAFIAALMPEDWAEKYGLHPQIDPSKNHESRKTNFRLTCDTRYGKSGCSAVERAQTVNILGGRFAPYNSDIFSYADPDRTERVSQPTDLVRPGHIIPIAANPQGLYARQGHTETGVELMKLAGITPSVAIDMEILHPDGTMAKAGYIRELADEKGYRVITVRQVCDYLQVKEFS